MAQSGFSMSRCSFGTGASFRPAKHSSARALCSSHGIYRYVMVLVPLTLAVAEDRTGVRDAIVAFNLVFGTIMILAFVTNNRLAV
jgi:hypothetical protein